MKKYLLLFCCVCCALFALSQDLNKSFASIKLSSELLKEEREIIVSLPPNYNNPRYEKERYPILYFFDGETSIGYYKAITQFLSKGVYASIPEMILVGIKNKNRTKDLTPTRSSLKSPEDGTKLLFENSGGNEQLSGFIERELIPYMDAHYRTDSFKILSGHSFGGLATANMMISRPQLFNAYILLDPSIWWDNGFIARSTPAKTPTMKATKPIIYMAVANNDEKKAALNAGDTATQALHQSLSSHKGDSLLYQYKWYEKEDHGTIALPALYDGLKFIFKGFLVDFKDLYTQPTAITDGYLQFSKRVHHPFLPSQQKLDFMINYFKENKKADQEKGIRALSKDLYPTFQQEPLN